MGVDGEIFIITLPTYSLILDLFTRKNISKTVPILVTPKSNTILCISANLYILVKNNFRKLMRSYKCDHVHEIILV